jgi:hypothetical protein
MNCCAKGDPMTPEAIHKRPELLFKAAEHAHGKPRQTVEQDLPSRIEIRWQDDLITRLEKRRKRLAAARDGQDDA